MQGSQTRNIYAGRRVQAPAGSYRRPSAAQTARGKREKQRSRLERRRMLQVTVSAAILVIVVVVKLAMPDVLNRCRTQLLALMGEDTDFVAAFSAVGRAVSGDGSVGSALNDAYTAVFGPSHADDPAEEPANYPAQTGAEEETPPAEDGAPVYSAANTPAQVCLLQQQLGFAYAAPVAGEVTSAFGLRTHPLDGEERVVRKNPSGGFFRKKYGRARERLYFALCPLQPRDGLVRAAGGAGRPDRRGGADRSDDRLAPAFRAASGHRLSQPHLLCPALSGCACRFPRGLRCCWGLLCCCRPRRCWRRC